MSEAEQIKLLEKKLSDETAERLRVHDELREIKRLLMSRPPPQLPSVGNVESTAPVTSSADTSIPTTEDTAATAPENPGQILPAHNTKAYIKK